jgi:hypothetical protein
LLSLTSVAGAQQEVVDRCRQASDDAERIACLEAAILGRGQTKVAGAQTQTDPPSPQLEAGSADTSNDDSAKAAGAHPGASGIGASQVIARQQSQDDRLASLEEARGLRVASYATVPFEKLVVTLENGQVWRQINGDNQKIRVDGDRNQTVDITESSLGGYKLRLNEMRRTLRVERIK